MESKITLGEFTRLITGKRQFWVYEDADAYNNTGEQFKEDPSFTLGGQEPTLALSEGYHEAVVLAARMIGKRKIAVLITSPWGRTNEP